MEFSICLGLFVLGTIFGSFYNVVGYRLPKGESLIYPPSHCPSCNHRLGPLELIPILSFVFQGGKCKNCHKKIAWYYPIFEAACGLLFMLAYLRFGFTYDIIIALTFISMLIIVMVSDYYYMIICDSVLVFFGLLILIEKVFINGFDVFLTTLISGIISFIVMYLLKLFGDFIFKRESMGGGDIKLLLIFGITLGWKNALFSIIVGSFIGLPISLIMMMRRKSDIIPFGPFLSMGALVILLTQLDFNFILKLLGI